MIADERDPWTRPAASVRAAPARQRHPLRRLVAGGVWFAILIIGLSLVGAALARPDVIGQLRTRLASSNLVRNGGFEDASGWHFLVRDDAVATFDLDTEDKLAGRSAGRVTVLSPTPQSPWDAQLSQGSISLVAGQSYILSLAAKGTQTAGFQVVLQQSTAPYRIYFQQHIQPDTAWQTYRFDFTLPVSDASALLALNFGESAGDTLLDAVSLEAGSLPRTPDSADPVDGGWKLAWSDEFNGTSLDPTKWNIEDHAPGSVPAGGFRTCCLDDGLQYWTPQDVAVHGGALVLTSEHRSLGKQSYTSGAVSTLGKAAFLYGRIDIRAQLPYGKGMWSAFWLLPVTGTTVGYSPQEIDMMETLGQDPQTMYFVHHWYTDGSHHHEDCTIAGPDYSAGFHVFSLRWSASALDWYVDGVPQCHLANGVPTTPMYLILNTYVGGSWPGPPANATTFPQFTTIDYVRVYTPA